MSVNKKHDVISICQITGRSLNLDEDIHRRMPEYNYCKSKIMKATKMTRALLGVVSLLILSGWNKPQVITSVVSDVAKMDTSKMDSFCMDYYTQILTIEFSDEATAGHL
jgi:hypothetical protein